MLAYMYLRLASAYKSSKYRMIFLVKHIILVIHYCTASAVSKIWVRCTISLAAMPVTTSYH